MVNSKHYNQLLKKLEQLPATSPSYGFLKKRVETLIHMPQGGLASARDDEAMDDQSRDDVVLPHFEMLKKRMERMSTA